ncbi:MFS transporter [Miltoncostaea marina]|uniref:MFS transporter n=1 Tax=Miltoncostaea marina TaxID=2843215 RepID=UPI001C3C2106|nr:MFS transporter [Miltoncostaea marina]
MSSPAPAEAGHDRRWLVLVLVCIAQFMVVLDATVVNVALPSIQTDLEFSPSSLQWVVNAYTLAFGGFLLLGGRAADFVGRRRLFVAGVVLFTTASLVCGLSESSGVLVAARALQGLGGAMVSPAALSIVTTTFKETRERTKALSIWAAIAVGGAAVGLLLGGVLTEYMSWEWAFFVNVPVGIASVLLSLRFVPESTVAGARGIDVGGAISVTAGLTLLVYGIVKTEAYGWASAETALLLGGAAVLLAAFVVIELRHRAPLVRLGVFRTRSLAGANVSMLAVTGGMFSVFYFASIYVQQTLGFSPVQAGLAFLPLTAGIIVFSGIAQQLIGRVGVRPVGLTGMAVAAVGLLLLSRAGVDGTYVADLLPGLLVMSAGLGLTFVPLTLIATAGVADADAGLASGVFNSSQQIGGALGLAILTTIATGQTEGALEAAGPSAGPAEQASAMVEGFQAAFAGGAGLMLAGVVILAVWVRRRDVADIQASEGPAVHGI